MLKCLAVKEVVLGSSFAQITFDPGPWLMEMDYQSDSSDEDSTETPLLLIRRSGNTLHFEQPEEKPPYMSMHINGVPVAFMRGRSPRRGLFRTVTLLFRKKDDSWDATCRSGDPDISSDGNNDEHNDTTDKGLIDSPQSDVVEGNPDQDNPSVADIEADLETTGDLPSVSLDGPLVDDTVAGFSNGSSPFSAPSLSDLDLESSSSSSSSSSKNSLFSVFYPSLDPNHRLADPTKRAAYDSYERKSLGNRESAAPSFPLEKEAPIWKGAISLKCYFTNVEMHVIAGCVQLATTCLLTASEHTTIQIIQKADIEEKKFENRYMKNGSKLTTLIALPSKVCRCCYNNLQPFQNYFTVNKMSGIVTCSMGVPSVTYVMQFFPKCDLTTRYTRSLDPLLTHRLRRESYLVIIIEPMSQIMKYRQLETEKNSV